MDYKILRKIVKKDKRGIMGLDTARAFFLLLGSIAILGFAIVIIMATLDDTNVLTEDSYGDNQTTNILQNVSSAVANFFDDAGTWLTLLSIVIIIMIITVVIIAIGRFGGGTRGL